MMSILDLSMRWCPSLRTRGEIIIRRSIFPLLSCSKRESPKYHASIWSYASSVSGIPVPNVVYYDPDHLSIIALSAQYLMSIPSSPMNPVVGGNP